MHESTFMDAADSVAILCKRERKRGFGNLYEHCEMCIRVHVQRASEYLNVPKREMECVHMSERRVSKQARMLVWH